MNYLNYIGGEWLKGERDVPNINPSDISDVIGTASFGDQEMAERAVKVAAETAKTWNNSPVEFRSDILHSVGQDLLNNSEAYGRLLSREQGKPLKEGIGEAARAGRVFRFFAGEAIRLSGSCGPSTRSGVDVRVDRMALGAVGLITPWNFPLAIPAWKIAPALAFGNTVVLKSAQITPACADLLAKLLEKAGLPAGVFNLVHGSGREIGNAMVQSEFLDGISFTGSEGVGAGVRLGCAETGKKCQLELGGKNPLVIADDADLEIAVDVAIGGSFGGSGQKCTASSRIIAMKNIYAPFTKKLTEKMLSLKVGHALEDGTVIGPLADENQLRSVTEFVGKAQNEGAEVIGGHHPETGYEGHYISPALFLQNDPKSESSVEEIFGPCVSVFKVDDFDAAIAMANDTRFGLSSGICTQSLSRAEQFRHKVKTGLTMINLPTAGVDYHVPFGGRKASSYGPKEQGTAAVEFYTSIKTTYTAP
jgi:alpha-ketoglutaric semialdehyde dehydrogenase